MHKKQQILDAISQVLDAMGVDADIDADDFDENGLTSTNEVPIWSKLDVSVNDEGRGPIHSKDALFGVKKMTQPTQVDAYGMPMPGDQEEMMSALGLV